MSLFVMKRNYFYLPRAKLTFCFPLSSMDLLLLRLIRNFQRVLSLRNIKKKSYDLILKCKNVSDYVTQSKVTYVRVQLKTLTLLKNKAI